MCFARSTLFESERVRLDVSARTRVSTIFAFACACSTSVMVAAIAPPTCSPAAAAAGTTRGTCNTHSACTSAVCAPFFVSDESSCAALPPGVELLS